MFEKLMRDIKWKDVFKDIAKFYLLYLILCVFTVCMIWVYWGLTLEKQKLSIEDIFTPNWNVSQQALDLDSVFVFVQTILGYIFPLVIFAVFFRAPPRQLTHVCIVTFLICLISALNFFKAGFLIVMQDTLILFSLAIMSWKLSTIKHEKRKNRISGER